MGIVNISSKKLLYEKKEGKNVFYNYYNRTDLKKFNEKILGVGELTEESRQLDAIAAIFDLSGFTDFCAQPDPYLVLPKYLSRFIKWLFDNIVNEQTFKKYRKGRLLHTHLPFFAKFLGDGVLLLWDTKDMNMVNMCNVILLLSRTCRRYNREFVPQIKKEMSYVPRTLRCGAARGSVCTVGGGRDYVGVCINTASRLQKLGSLTFCFACKGIDFSKAATDETLKMYTTKLVEIRGVGKEELVYVRVSEYDKLSQKERKNFKDVE